MDINPHELRQVTQFKDSVISAADARRTQIIGTAQRASDTLLASAKATCQLARHDVISAKLSTDTERQASAATLAARTQLLKTRETLVNDLFAEVQQRLSAFSQSNDYDKWLAKKLAPHAASFEETADVTVYLRGTDMHYAPALKNILPHYAVRPDDTIRLGGFKVTDGQRLFDETLDAALAAARENFYLTSGLTL